MDTTLVTIIASTISMGIGIMTVHIAHAKTAKRVEQLAQYVTMFSLATMEHIRVLRKETNLPSWENSDDSNESFIKL